MFAKLCRIIKDLINGGLFVFSFVSMISEVGGWEYGLWFQGVGFLATVFGYVLVMLFVLIPHGLLFSVEDMVGEAIDDFKEKKQKTGRLGVLGILIIGVVSSVGSVSGIIESLQYIRHSIFLILSFIIVSICIAIARQKKIKDFRNESLNKKQWIILSLGILLVSVVSIIFGILPVLHNNIVYNVLWVIIICIIAVVFVSLCNKSKD